MNIVIDPYMLELENEDEIRHNISFFRVLYFLSKSRGMGVVLFKDLVDKMLCREVKPFPIHIGKIKDENLKASIININTLFVSVVMNHITPIDIEVCKGEQDFEIQSDKPIVESLLRNDDKYCELLSVLLQPCYNLQLNLSNTIVTGDISKGLKVFDEFYIRCQCTGVSFYQKYSVDFIDKFASDADRAYFELDKTITEKGDIFVKNPVIVRGRHHNFLQSNSQYSSYEGLSRVNKSVISLLRYFGLSKVIFGEFHEDSSYAQGTIITNDMQFTDTNDIVKGWLFAETGYKNHVDLYFPKSIGKNLMIYFDNVFERNNVQRLVDNML